MLYLGGAGAAVAVAAAPAAGGGAAAEAAAPAEEKKVRFHLFIIVSALVSSFSCLCAILNNSFTTTDKFHLQGYSCFKVAFVALLEFTVVISWSC